jgi:hypothetical protein
LHVIWGDRVVPEAWAVTGWNEYDDAGPLLQRRERRRGGAFGHQDEREVRHAGRYSETVTSDRAPNRNADDAG